MLPGENRLHGHKRLDFLTEQCKLISSLITIKLEIDVAQKIASPLSKDEVEKTCSWLEKNKKDIPDSIYKNLSLALKCCEAIDHLKFKIKDMIGLLSQHMGLTSKSEKGHATKHRWGIFTKS